MFDEDDVDVEVAEATLELELTTTIGAGKRALLVNSSRVDEPPQYSLVLFAQGILHFEDGNRVVLLAPFLI